MTGVVSSGFGRNILLTSTLLVSEDFFLFPIIPAMTAVSATLLESRKTGERWENHKKSHKHDGQQ